MTTTKTTAKANAETAATKTASKVDEAVEATKANASKMTDTAREYVQRTAATAKERSDDAYEGVSKFNSGMEKAMSRMLGAYVGIMGEMAEAAHANVNHALATVEKTAKATSLTEAAQVQVDFYRESSAANYDRARTAFEATRDAVSEGVTTIREGASDMLPYGKKAA